MNENISDLPGARLRQLRLANILSLAELARRSGTSPSALHRYESGWGSFELRTLARLAAALGARVTVRLIPVLEDESLTSAQLVHRWRRLFWDVDLAERHLESNEEWVLRRLLQFGNLNDVHQARLFFGNDAVRRAASHRSMDGRTKRFWSVVLGGPKGQP